MFGPVTARFAEQNLQPQRAAGACLAFNADGDTDFQIKPGVAWEDVVQRLPDGWRPDVLVLWPAYGTVPECLWQAPLPRIALATDWHLQWHHYRGRVGQCDLFVTDAPGAEVLRRQGFPQARAGILCGLEWEFLELACSPPRCGEGLGEGTGLTAGVTPLVRPRIVYVSYRKLKVQPIL